MNGAEWIGVRILSHGITDLHKYRPPSSIVMGALIKPSTSRAANLGLEWSGVQMRDCERQEGIAGWLVSQRRLRVS